MGRFRCISAFLLQLFLAGCYTMRPLRGVEPKIGTVIAVEVNDAGRTALSGSMGPDLEQVEGQLIEGDTASYLVAVSSVRLRQGGQQVWSGERIRIRPEYFYNMYERHFSWGRSLALGAIGVGGIATVALTASLLGSGSSDNGNGGCPDPTNPDCPTTRLGRP